MSYTFKRLLHPVGTKKYKLEIWDNATVEGDRTKPFNFKANYLLERKQEAREILALFGISECSKVA